jgi:hypothetical protein
VPLRPHPHLYEINTRPWLEAMSRHAGRHLTLGAVPDTQWDTLQANGIDLVYLMGVWRRSMLGRQIARSEPCLFGAYDEALPGWRARDVVGSAYCVAGHQPDPRIGTWQDLDDVREKLHTREMQLIVDFIPNHVGFDHPWMNDHPDRFVQAPEEAFRRDPSAYRAVETRSGDVRFIACGRDPFFPPWTDVAQLDYFNEDTRAAMIAELQEVSAHADGARCDMAMLALSDVFARTWAELLTSPAPATEFWHEARAAVPGFMLLAEVYWDLEWRLQELGFDFTYDKRLYDRLIDRSVGDVRAHLGADAEYQRRSARFIENHDEPPSVIAFGDRVRPAAVVMSTLPGLRFFHDGQFEGRQVRMPVQLGVRRDEPVDEKLAAFYRRLLDITVTPAFHSGDWRVLEVVPARDETAANLLAWRWKDGEELRIVAVNLSDGPAQGHLRVNADLPARVKSFEFDDLLNGGHYSWTRAALDAAGGLYVRLDGGGSHIFAVS